MPGPCCIFRGRQIQTGRLGGLVVGGAKRDRTADLLNAIQALSQLSYSPIREMTRLRYHSFCPPVKYIH